MLIKRVLHIKSEINDVKKTEKIIDLPNKSTI